MLCVMSLVGLQIWYCALIDTTGAYHQACTGRQETFITHFASNQMVKFKVSNRIHVGASTSCQASKMPFLYLPPRNSDLSLIVPPPLPRLAGEALHHPTKDLIQSNWLSEHRLQADFGSDPVSQHKSS